MCAGVRLAQSLLAGVTGSSSGVKWQVQTICKGSLALGKRATLASGLRPGDSPCSVPCRQERGLQGIFTPGVFTHLPAELK